MRRGAPLLTAIGRAHATLRFAFRALRHMPFRVFWMGQWISVTGSWMQTTALSWLAYRLSDSALVLGVLSVARFGPSLIGSPLAGVLTDRVSRRRLVLATQSLALAQAASLAALTLGGVIRVWHVLVLAAFQGVVETIDTPARQTFQVELVGLEDVQSAVSLNSSAFNLGRMLGPALAGLVVAAYGEGLCFALNAASYLAVLAALLRLPEVPANRGKRAGVWRDLRAGVHFATGDARVRAALLAVAGTSLFGMSYATVLPVIARDALGGGSPTYGALLAGGGLGAIVGALVATARSGVAGAGRFIALAQAGLGAGLVLLAGAWSVATGGLAMVLIGGCVALQLATTNGFIQVRAPDGLRGRVISLYVWLFVGLSSLGGLVAGWAAEQVGARSVIAAAGLGCIVLAALARRSLLHTDRA